MNDNNPVFRNSGTVSTSRMDSGHNRNLPELTIPNLVEEIRRNGIKYPKIVLAQAILETGWFKSSVCRNKHNLFGLTNPRTGEYYEFSHWTESVRAYYTKVQYRYKGRKLSLVAEKHRLCRGSGLYPRRYPGTSTDLARNSTYRP